MLSYQHIYHAGNFADVQKHAVLVKLLQALAQKPQKFNVLDTHAGRGIYDIGSDEAQKIGEYKSGIIPFWEGRGTASPISDYLEIIAKLNDGNTLKLYPGTAKIEQMMMRKSDTLALIEKHPGEYAELQKTFTGTSNVTVEQKDGFQMLTSRVPLPDRRGIVIVDPSYEIKSEFTELPRLLQQAYKKWPQGQFMIWYPVLKSDAHRRMLTDLRRGSVKDMLVSEIVFEKAPEEAFSMYGTGIIIINPPFGFETTLRQVTSYIAEKLPLKAKGKVAWLDNLEISPETGMLPF